jgi:16S rRNA (cytosine967-C5)-methyltransferase
MKIIPMGNLDSAHKDGILSDGTVQLWTHHNHSDAMFMAILEKVG